MANYDISLIVHGVPEGQKIWGRQDADVKYIETFYARKSDMPVQLLVEIMKFEGKTYSYYTYFRIGNLQDKGGRPGSYFALTLRINYYYADIQNIYNLLDAAFNKYIVGTVLSHNNGNYRFLIPEFDSVDGDLKSLEKEIEHYLFQFSSDSDFVPLDKFKSNGQNEPGRVNLIEASSSVVQNHIKTNANISVSPLYPSSKEKQIIKQMNDDIQAAKDDAQKKIQEAETAKENGINAVEQKYKDVDKTIKDLKTKLDTAEQYKSKYETANSALQTANANLQKVQAALETEKYNTQDMKNVLGSIKSSLSTLEINGISHNSTGSGKKNNDVIPEPTPIWQTMFSRYFNLIVIVLLVCILCLTAVKGCVRGGGDKPDDPNSPDKKRIEQLEAELENRNGQIVELKKKQTASSNSSECENGIKQLFSNSRIDISNMGVNNPMTYGSAKKYSATLQSSPSGLTGKWQSNDFTIDGNKISPKHQGKCTLNYIVFGVVVQSREIVVQ